MDDQELITEIKELTRTIRGYNGTPGMFTRLELIKQSVDNLSETIERINERGCDYARQESYPRGGDPHLQSGKPESAEKQSITFQWLVEKLTVPVLVAVIIGIINAILIAKYITPLIP